MDNNLERKSLIKSLVKYECKYSKDYLEKCPLSELKSIYEGITLGKYRKNMAGQISRNGGVFSNAEPIRTKRNGISLIKADNGEFVEEFE